MKRLLFLLLTLSALSPQLSSLEAQEYRDVVFLRNGSIIKGQYKEIVTADSVIHMTTLDGSTINVPQSEIVRIAKEKTDVYVVKEKMFIGERTWRPRGYRGFIDYINGLRTTSSSISIEGLSTYHGYQFNSHWFLGAGLHLNKYKAVYEGYSVQSQNNTYGVLANARWFILNTRIAPYIDARGGYHFAGDKGPVCIGGVGADLCVSPRFGFNVGLYYEWFRCDDTDNSGGKTNIEFINLVLGLHF